MWRNGGLKTSRTLILAKYGSDFRKAAEACKLSVEKLEGFIVDPFLNKPTVNEAIMLSQNLGVPLAPSATLFWTSLGVVQEVESLQKWLVSSDVKVEDGIVSEITGSSDRRCG